MTTATTVKRRIKKQSPSVIMCRLLAHKSKQRSDLMKAMNVTYPTVRTLLSDPATMDGYQRLQYAKVVGMPVDVIDDIINKKYADLDGVINGTYAEALRYGKPV